MYCRNPPIVNLSVVATKFVDIAEGTTSITSFLSNKTHAQDKRLVSSSGNRETVSLKSGQQQQSANSIRKFFTSGRNVTFSKPALLDPPQIEVLYEPSNCSDGQQASSNNHSCVARSRSSSPEIQFISYTGDNVAVSGPEYVESETHSSNEKRLEVCNNGDALPVLRHWVSETQNQTQTCSERQKAFTSQTVQETQILRTPNKSQTKVSSGNWPLDESRKTGQSLSGENSLKAGFFGRRMLDYAQEFEEGLKEGKDMSPVEWDKYSRILSEMKASKINTYTETQRTEYTIATDETFSSVDKTNEQETPSNEEAPIARHPEKNDSNSEHRCAGNDPRDADSADYSTCDQCGSLVSAWDLPEHLDFHFAQQLQKVSSL